MLTSDGSRSSQLGVTAEWACSLAPWARQGDEFPPFLAQRVEHAGDMVPSDPHLAGEQRLHKNPVLRRRGTDGSQTLPWRKPDSNSRSRREGKGYGEPLQASIAVSDLNL